MKGSELPRASPVHAADWPTSGRAASATSISQPFLSIILLGRNPTEMLLKKDASRA